jgi:hypothetical protein
LMMPRWNLQQRKKQHRVHVDHLIDKVITEYM